MRILDFSEEVGINIHAFDSDFVMSRITKSKGNLHIGFMKITYWEDMMPYLHSSSLLFKEKDGLVGKKIRNYQLKLEKLPTGRKVKAMKLVVNQK